MRSWSRGRYWKELVRRGRRTWRAGSDLGSGCSASVCCFLNMNKGKRDKQNKRHIFTEVLTLKADAPFVILYLISKIKIYSGEKPPLSSSTTPLLYNLKKPDVSSRPGLTSK